MLNVGIVGAGAIAPPYYMAVAAWPQLRFLACTSRRMESARRMAAQHGVAAVPLATMLADPAIDTIVNLTPIQAHYATSKAILEAGKHLYSEKPLAATVAQARELLVLAEARGLRVGCAPDTFFGSAHQEARAAVDSGAIGTPVGAALFLGTSGCEAWHPYPEPFYQTGAGPVADHAPYYLTQLVNLLGPVAAVTAMSTLPAKVRTLGNKARAGETIVSEVDTTASGVIEMEGGQLVTLTMSWDMGPHGRNPIEVYGTGGSLHNPDPNWSDGPVRVVSAEGTVRDLDHTDRAFSRPTMITFQGNPVAYYRLCGLADMADAIAQGRPHRASGGLAFHVLEVIEAVRLSSELGRRIEIASRCERPAPIGDDISDAATIKPFGEELLDARTLF
ncbi:MAG: Gfo/Idh/MocA family oxidoreductase [Novosphingobium sp.]